MIDSFLFAGDAEVTELVRQHPFTPQFKGNPFKHLKQYVGDNTSLGRNLLGRLDILAGQFEDRIRQRQEPVIQELLTKLPADFTGDRFAEAAKLTEDPDTLWRLGELSAEYQAGERDRKYNEQLERERQQNTR